MRELLDYISIDNIKVRIKLFLLYILCILIPLAMAYAVLLRSVTGNLKMQYSSEINASVEKTKLTVFENIEDAIYLSNTIFADKNLYEFLDSRFSDYSEFYEVYARYYKSALTSKIAPIYKQIEAVNIYTDNDSLYESDGLIKIDEDTKKTPWYKDLNLNGQKTLLMAYVDLSSGSLSKGNDHKFISIIRKMDYVKRDGNNSAKILKIDFQKSAFNDLLKNAYFKGRFFVVDGGRNIIFSSESGINSDKSSFTNMNSLDFHSSDVVVEQGFDIEILKDWHVIGEYDGVALSRVIWDSRKYIYIFALGSFLLATSVIFIISRSLTRRLKILSQHLGSVRKQKYDIIPYPKGKDEIGEVIGEFNRMTEKIWELIQNEYITNLQKQRLELERRQAEINALQSQMNPHFLFNTLESIRMRSSIKNEHETADIIKHLSKTIRKMLVWDRDLITVREEMELIGHFLIVQKYRFGEKISYEISVEEDCLDCGIPKMTLQPLVENACIHGLEGIRENGIIRISVRKVDEYLQCEVEDNGIGMSPEQIRKMKRVVENERDDGVSVGIKNVYNRLKLFFGTSYKFEMDSTEGKGTRVRICIPVHIPQDLH